MWRGDTVVGYDQRQGIYAPEAAWKINAPTSVASMTLTVTLVWLPDPLDKPSKLESIPVKNVA